MAKPEAHKGEDAIKIKCVKDYTVKAGSGATAGEDAEFKAGTIYTVAPTSGAHLLRKVYARHAPATGEQKRGKYLGDANHFVAVRDEDKAKEKQPAPKGDK